MTPPLVKKKVDSRIRTLLENGVKANHRTFYVIVGDRGRDQVMYLHFMLSKARIQAKPNVLWCYKKELGFTSHRKKRMKQIQQKIKNGLREADEHDPFELFIAGTEIRYCYYNETQKILGNTYGMCVLQDFEALTPNLLARTIETVEGGGVVVLLLRTMKSLKQLYTMSMDVHMRYRTESHNDVVNRFNERFILSLGSQEHCLIVDDELNILPISAGRRVQSLPSIDNDLESNSELVELKHSLKETQPAGSLVSHARTIDQAKGILTFIEATSDKSLRNTVSLTAARGRGKSAALGIAMASAVAYGYSNIFVTSPSPENLKTLFEFVFKALDSLGYQQHIDYDIVQSTNPDFNKAVVRVNIFREHRQTIQYIQPQDSHVLSQAELVVIDEAAAIPLPLIKKLLGPYLVFMASTINGYEGTGRSLSLKLLQSIRQQSRGVSLTTAESGTAAGAVAGRSLKEIKLEEPIRYSLNDPTEKWLNGLLCLDATTSSRLGSGCPHPSDCDLYFVNRDTLFSFHPVSEAFLQRMMSLYVSSHYKNQPNDLQLMADAPAHQLFVLLPPVTEETTLPEPLVVIQVCLEGEISRESLLNSLNRGKRADGDLIPWCVSQQFQDDDFASLSGARVVRIAAHPDYARMGYGSRALHLLMEYFEGKIASVAEMDEGDNIEGEAFKQISEVNLEPKQSKLHTETLNIRDASSMPPLLLTLAEKKSPNLHWLGVSFGLTAQLLRFWKRADFAPVYLRQTQNELTGENTCVMLRTLEKPLAAYDVNWLSAFTQDFKQRFMSLCGYQFREFTTATGLSVLDATENTLSVFESEPLTAAEVNESFSAYDLKRLESYANNNLDYHVIVDLVPVISRHYFQHRLKSVKKSKAVALDEADAEDAPLSDDQDLAISSIQRSILFGMGCQYKSVDQLSAELQIPAGQILALFIRLIKKSVAFYRRIQTDSLTQDLNIEQQSRDTVVNPLKRDIKDSESWDPALKSMEQELQENAQVEMTELRLKQREMIDSLNLSQFEIASAEEDWSQMLSGKIVSKKGSGVVSLKNTDSTKKRKNVTTMQQVAETELTQLKPKKSKKKQK